MLPPRFELGSRADPALARYKRAALPVKLREQIIFHLPSDIFHLSSDEPRFLNDKWKRSDGK
jgi:hypothetical protein